MQDLGAKMFRVTSHTLTRQFSTQMLRVFSFTCLLFLLSCRPHPYTQPSWSVSLADFPFALDVFQGLPDYRQQIAIDNMGNSYFSHVNVDLSTDSQLIYSLVKYDAQGVLAWSTQLTPTANRYVGADAIGEVMDYFEGVTIKIDNNGNLYVLQPLISNPNFVDADWVLTKFDAAGNGVWQQIHATPDLVEIPVALVISETNQPVVLSADFTYLDRTNVQASFSVVALDDLGNMRWSHQGPLITQRIDSLVQIENTQLYIANSDVLLSFLDFTLNQDGSVQQITPVVTSLSSIGGVNWEFRATPESPSTFFSGNEIDRSMKHRIYRLLGTDSIGNLYMKKGNHRVAGTLQKWAIDGTVLWQTDFAHPFQAKVTQDGEPVVFEIPNVGLGRPVSVTVTHLDANAQLISQKQIRTGSTLTNPGLPGLVQIPNIYQDHLDRFYIDSAIFHCASGCYTKLFNPLNALTSSIWNEILIVDAQANLLKAMRFKSYFLSPFAQFDQTNNLFYSGGGDMRKFDMSTLPSPG